MRIRSFDPATTGETDLLGCYGVFTASEAVETPDEQVMAFEHYVGRLKNPAPGIGPTH